MLFYVCTLTF